MPEGSEPDIESIEQAIERYRSALPLLKPAAAQTLRVQKLLADALAASGKRRLDPARLDEAAAVYRGLLAPAATKPDVATSGNYRLGLATVLREIGRIRTDAAAIDEAISVLTEIEAQAAPRWLVDHSRQLLVEYRVLQRQLAGQRADAPAHATVTVGRLLQRRS